jgi:hypothetical protein
MGLDIDFEFYLGDTEQHRVDFHWGQTFGRVRITVDDVEVLGETKALRFHSSPVRTFEFSVGHTEQHAVRIEKIRKRFLGGARKQSCRVFVDGALIGEYPRQESAGVSRARHAR